MSHYTVDYSLTPPGEDKVRAALIDFIRWDRKAYRIITRAWKRGEASEGEVRFACMMIGVEGYPAQCLIDRYSPEKST